MLEIFPSLLSPEKNFTWKGVISDFFGVSDTNQKRRRVDIPWDKL